MSVETSRIDVACNEFFDTGPRASTKKTFNTANQCGKALLVIWRKSMLFGGVADRLDSALEGRVYSKR